MSGQRAHPLEERAGGDRLTCSEVVTLNTLLAKAGLPPGGGDGAPTAVEGSRVGEALSGRPLELTAEELRAEWESGLFNDYRIADWARRRVPEMLWLLERQAQTIDDLGYELASLHQR